MNDPAPSALPSDEALPPAVAVTEPSPEERDYQRARVAFLLPERASGGGFLLLGTLALFALSMWRDHDWRGLVLLVSVLFFHELGHWAGMRLFGFQDVRMFFIPFFGAAVSGRNQGAESWKEALVLLLGPVPGILVGCVLVVGAIALKSPGLSQAALLLLALNGFNLLPLVPLDGGRLFQLLLFSRHRYLELAFTVLTSLALMGVSLAFESWVLTVVGLFNLLGVFRQSRLLRQVHPLRATEPGLSRPQDQLDDASMRALYTASLEVVGTSGEHEPNAYQGRARAMKELHQRVRQHPPSVLASLALSGAWFGGLVALFVGLALWAGSTRP